MDETGFTPFYERTAGSFLRKVLVCLLLGAGFLGLRYLDVGRQMFTDWSWFLGLLISAAMLALYIATYTLHAILPEMAVRVPPNSARVYREPLTRVLSDRHFVLAGLGFGILNCVFGFTFGLPVIGAGGVVTILVGYFLSGVVCGMAVFGIYGVSVAIRAFARPAAQSFDFASPDRCGGTVFLGEALVVFGSVTLVVGVMISVYILNAPWTREPGWWVNSLKMVWIGFPYMSSIVAFVAPAIPLNKALREYKLSQEVELQERLAAVRGALDEGGLEGAVRAELREDYEFQTKLRMDLHKMRPWPFGFGANAKYLVVVMTNGLASFRAAKQWIEGL